MVMISESVLVKYDEWSVDKSSTPTKRTRLAKNFCMGQTSQVWNHVRIFIVIGGLFCLQTFCPFFTMNQTMCGQCLLPKSDLLTFIVYFHLVWFMLRFSVAKMNYFFFKSSEYFVQIFLYLELSDVAWNSKMAIFCWAIYCLEHNRQNPAQKNFVYFHKIENYTMKTKPIQQIWGIFSKKFNSCLSNIGFFRLFVEKLLFFKRLIRQFKPIKMEILPHSAQV